MWPRSLACRTSPRRLVRAGCRRALAAATAVALVHSSQVFAGPSLAEPAYTIAVHVSSDKPPSTGPEEVSAIRDFVQERAAALNEAGGIKGRRVEVVVYDDKTDGAETIANVDRALAEPNLIAMVGLWNSTRGAPVMERIGKSGVPLISEISVETLFKPYPNIFTLTRSVRDEQAAFAAFARDNFKRIAFVGSDEDLYTRAYHEHIQTIAADLPIVSTFWLKGSLEDNNEAVDRAVAEIRQSNADVIFLSITSKKGAPFLKRLTAAGIALPVVIGLGSINGIVNDAGGGGRNYGGAIYEIAEGGIANLNNERLEQLMRRRGALREGRNYSAYAVGYGARYADLVALVADAGAKSATGSVEDIRRAIGDQLAGLGEGRRIWRGWAQDWSFTAERASAEQSLLVWRPPGQNVSVLAPMQYVRSATGISRVPVLYVHLDMTRIFHVDSSDKSFEAEFFFTLRSQRVVPITAIEFTNVQTSAETAAPLINIREVHQEPPTAAGEPGARIYKVAGRFQFEPDLRKYPFDEQIFSISFQPAKTSAAFLLQPPSEAIRDEDVKELRVDGWRVNNHYVGTNELIIRSIEGPTSEAHVIPYYNFNYTWVMRRQVVDYVLRVIVPLSFIMIVAYVAIFIPRSEFEAIMGIQVTALLSAIALYLALNQPEADDATLSDTIFVMAYASISAMIALSVLEVNPTVGRSGLLMRGIHVLQVYLVPLVALAVIAIVIASASYDLSVGELFGAIWR